MVKPLRAVRYTAEWRTGRTEPLPSRWRRRWPACAPDPAFRTWRRDTSSRKSSSSARSWKRTLALPVGAAIFVLLLSLRAASAASTIFTLALAPMRVAPAAIIFRTSSKRANSARSLYTHVRSDRRRASARRRVRSRRKDRSRWRFSRNPRRPSWQACTPSSFVIVIQERGFKDHFHDGAAAVRGLRPQRRCQPGRHRDPPLRSAPMFCTMSISCAPTRRAASVSATFATVSVAPNGNPTTVQIFTGDPASSAATSGTQYELMHTLAKL